MEEVSPEGPVHFSQLCPGFRSILQWQIPPQPWLVGLGGGISTPTQEAGLGVCSDFFLLAELLPLGLFPQAGSRARRVKFHMIHGLIPPSFLPSA